MKKVDIFDTTLRDGEQVPGNAMDPEKKMRIAKFLANMGVGVIEAGFPVSNPGDYKSVYQIAEEVEGPVIAGLSRCVDVDIIAAGEAIAPAAARGRGRVHTFSPTSDVQIEHQLKKTRQYVLEITDRSVRLAKEFTPDVEFSAMDATRTDINYLIDVVRIAVKAGATVINLPDTVGYAQPEEIRAMFRAVMRVIPSEDVVYSFHGHNDLGLAVANTLAAIDAGAGQAEVTINGIGERAGNAALEEVVMGIKTREDFYGYSTGIKTEMLVPASELVTKITGSTVQDNKAIVGANAFGHSSGIHQDGVLKHRETYEIMTPESVGAETRMVLTKASGRNQIRETLGEKGIPFEEADMDGIFERYNALASDVKLVYDDRLVMAVSGDTEIPEVYALVGFESGTNEEGSFAKVTMTIDGNRVYIEKQGEGQIDAAKKAINALTGMDLHMEEFRADALSEGSGAEGLESSVVRKNGYAVECSGIDTCIVRGTAKALVDASNKMRYVVGYVQNREPAD